ncbi:hypothetical protein Scep_028469 [Stephania cephalantha]|uniref:Uncharacterized protein n=1 Tax=Stephania cephalantha TaxID=152367 RepID=A0AAP0EEK8_9MAGN
MQLRWRFHANARHVCRGGRPMQPRATHANVTHVSRGGKANANVTHVSPG